MADNQERVNLYYRTFIHEYSISAVSLSIVLMKILFSLGIQSCYF